MTSINPLAAKAPLHTLIAAGVVLLVSASVGGAVGVVMDRYLILPHQYAQRGPGGGGERGGWRGGPGERGGRDGRGGPGRMGPGPGGMSSGMMDELGLSTNQRAQVDSVLAKELAQFRALREQFDPKMDTLMRRTRARIDSILTPTQRTKLESMQHDGGHWRDGGGDGAGGGPPWRGRARSGG